MNGLGKNLNNLTCPRLAEGGIRMKTLILAVTTIALLCLGDITQAEVGYIVEELNARNSLAPQYYLAQANAINNNSTIVGESVTESVYRAYMWSDGITQDLDENNPLHPYYYLTSAYGINDTNQVVGVAQYRVSMNQFVDKGFFYDNGTVLYLDTVNSLNGYILSDAHGINNQGQIVGRANKQGFVRAYLWKDGITTDLNDLNASYPSFILTEAYGINNSSDIVGTAWMNVSPYLNHAFLIRNGQITDLYASSLSNIYLTEAYGINDLNQIVGRAREDILSKAFLWQDGNTTILQDKIPLDSGWFLNIAMGINNNGQIVGIGQYNGLIRPFLLTPVPEPSSLFAVCGGVAGFLALRRRRK